MRLDLRELILPKLVSLSGDLFAIGFLNLTKLVMDDSEEDIEEDTILSIQHLTKLTHLSLGYFIYSEKNLCIALLSLN